MKDDTVYLDHIRESLNSIIEYTNSYDLKVFLADKKTQDAVIRQLEIIGEATKRISDQRRNANPQIPWEDMAGMRDKLIHDYIDVDLWIVWETASKDVPMLIELLKDIK